MDPLTYLATSFWIGAVHAATPGHGKTIAAAYIVGARGRPIDAVILGIFVTLSHTSGIVLVGVLASLGIPGFVPQRVEAWLALITGILVIVIGFWTLWTQREMLMQLQGIEPEHGHSHRHGQDALGHPAGSTQMRYNAVSEKHDHSHAHEHAHGHDHGHGNGAHTHHDHDEEGGTHSHGWGFKHTHDMKLATSNRPSLWILIWLGIAGGLLPDPAALGLLLSALAEGKVMLGMTMAVVFSLGFAMTLVGVGIIAAKVGQKVLDWLAGPWAMRLQVGTSLLIVVVGVVLTFNAWRLLSSLA